MLSESFAHAEEDMAARALREARVEAERICWRRPRRRSTPTATCSPARSAMRSTRLVAKLGGGAPGTDRFAIEAALKALGEGTEAFAAERMNRGIRRALAGRRIEDV